jgi:hypothetical protein
VWNSDELYNLARFVGRNADEFRKIGAYIRKPNDQKRAIPMDTHEKAETARAPTSPDLDT